MNKTSLISFLAALLLLVFVPSKSRAQSIKTYISADSLRAGDLVTLSITLTRAKSYDELIFPDSSSFSQNFELRSRKRYRVSKSKDSLAYQLQFWGVKNATIPAKPVKLISGTDTLTLYTQPVSVKFKSVIHTKKPELQPLKPIFEFARTWWLYLLIFLALLAIGYAAYYYYKKRQEEHEPEPKPVFEPQPFLNPLRELENNLRQLKDVPEAANINYEQFYINLGDAIRLYFEQMYQIPALESTSQEILYELKNRSVEDEIVQDTRTVLNEADMVKFAKFEPTHQQAKRALEKAENFYSTVKEKHQKRIQMMRRQHDEEVAQNRKAFEEAQKQKESV